MIDYSSALVEIEGHKARTGYRSRISRTPLNVCGRFWRRPYREALAQAGRASAWLVSRETLRVLHAAPNVVSLAPVILPNDNTRKAHPRRVNETVQAWDRRLRHLMGSQAWFDEHDDRVKEALSTLHPSTDQIVANIGKHWVRHAPIGRSHLMGWRKLDGSFWQEPSPYFGPGPHDHNHVDYSSTVVLEQVCRETIGRKRANVVLHVRDWQALMGVTVDGTFGPATEAATKLWQKGEGLEPDGIVGRETWARAGEHWFEAITVARDTSHGGKVAPAIVQALRDADRAWPNRNRASDGTLGDAAHQARPSDHNTGLAVDITHDPLHRCDAGAIALQAIQDPRVTYVIWNRQIANRAIQGGAWRPYNGSNPHTHHVHISIREGARNDVRSWAWAPDKTSANRGG